MKESAYQKAGVNIQAGADVVDRIKPHVKKTFRSGVMSGIGEFGALFDLKDSGYDDPVLVSATDGVGTKLRIAIETGCHDTIGIDLVAMCANDIIVQGGEPLFFLDYFATGALSPDVTETVVSGIAEGCVQAGCALIGGETAEMPGMYSDGDYDLAGFCVGAVDRHSIIDGSTVKEGDVLLGLASSGLHSNGYSLVRHIVKGSGVGYNDPAPFQKDISLGEALLAPTRIYVKSILSVIRKHSGAIKALSHITGGGFLENIPRVLPDACAVDIDGTAWAQPPVFQWLFDQGGVTPSDMVDTFNCGLGMVVACDPSDVNALKKAFEDEGEDICEIGTVKAHSDSSKPRVQINHLDRIWSP